MCSFIGARHEIPVQNGVQMERHRPGGVELQRYCASLRAAILYDTIMVTCMQPMCTQTPLPVKGRRHCQRCRQQLISCKQAWGVVTGLMPAPLQPITRLQFIAFNFASATDQPSLPHAVLPLCLQAVEGFAGCTINDLSWHRGGTAYALALESGEVLVQDMRMQASTADAGSSSAGCSSSASLHGLTGFGIAGVRDPPKARVHVRRSRQQRLQDVEQGGAANGTAAHDCFCVAFDPLHDYRLASGGADGYVKVLDMRRLDQPIEELGMHAGSVTSVAWSHSLPGLLVSGGDDGAVLLWDANKLQHAAAFKQQQQHPQGQPVQQQRPQQQQGLGLLEPRHIRFSNLTESVRQYSLPGLLFMHGGHLGPVGALAVNAERPWLVASGSAGLVEGADGAGRNVVVQRQPLMVWEPNTSEGLLC
jgi:hypothetical protein